MALIIQSDFQLLDVAGPMSVFESVQADDRTPEYQISVLSADGGAVRSSSGAVLMTAPLDARLDYDTVLICGGVGAVRTMSDPRVREFVLHHVHNGTRIGSICTGAFILAETGCLDGKPATTHWRYCQELSRRYPQVDVQSDRIWIRDGDIWTSAGVSAGIDLSLAMLTEDKGAAVAKGVARELVVYYRRPGGQTQFSALLEGGELNGRFSELLGWIRENLHRHLPVEVLAEKAAMSPRNFSRAFQRETGTPPARAVERIRIEAAREWVVRGTHSTAHIAKATGFGSTDRMRNAFVRHLGMTPQTIRRAF